MPGENDPSKPPLPAELLRPTPRDVRLSLYGIFAALLSLASAVGGLWGGAELYRRARLAERYVALFETEAVPARAHVVRVRPRSHNRRATIDYEYVADNASYRGRATVSGPDRNRFSAGSTTTVHYLASYPGASWLPGHAPSGKSIWPAVLVPLGGLIFAGVMLVCIRGQVAFLRDGRPTHAVVTKVARKYSDKGTYWRVDYEWTLLDGATRKGKYNHHKRRAPLVGSVIPILYDRDQPQRSRRYPLSLVAVR